jgi:hypothetical protein
VAAAPGLRRFLADIIDDVPKATDQIEYVAPKLTATRPHPFCSNLAQDSKLRTFG